LLSGGIYIGELAKNVVRDVVDVYEEAIINLDDKSWFALGWQLYQPEVVSSTPSPESLETGTLSCDRVTTRLERLHQISRRRDLEDFVNDDVWYRRRQT
jgi:hypothetical protein